MIRVSTLSQQLDDQHREMEVFCHSEGYDELVFVEDKGASAIKLNDQYRIMIQQVKECIENDKDIKCFAVWELSRAFRNEGVYYEIKTFLLEHKVQFIVKSPYLKLLNDDGTLNPGMEIAMSLFATLAKQEMELKKVRFKRAKDSMRQQGKFLGGSTYKFGYNTDKDGYIVIDEDDAKVVRLIFSLYSSGKYSIHTLYKELNEMGIKKSDGTPISKSLVDNMLRDTSYLGYKDNKIYPKMISDELWGKVEEVRKSNFVFTPKSQKYAFGSGIFKCSLCGNNMVVVGNQYRCRHHLKLSAPPHCDSDLSTRLDAFDGLLWWIASKEEIQSRMKLDADQEKEINEKILVLKEKINAAQVKLDECEPKRRRIVDAYVEGLYDKKTRDAKLQKLDEELKEYNDTILNHNESISRLLGVLESKDDKGIDIGHLTSIQDSVLAENDLKVMREIVQKHLKKITSIRSYFGRDRNKRSKKENAQLITITFVDGRIQRYYYIPRTYKGHSFYFYKEDGSEVPILNIKKIKRERNKSSDKRAFKKLKDW